jgi:hypothetical protein
VIKNRNHCQQQLLRWTIESLTGGRGFFDRQISPRAHEFSPDPHAGAAADSARPLCASAAARLPVPLHRGPCSRRRARPCSRRTVGGRDPRRLALAAGGRGPHCSRLPARVGTTGQRECVNLGLTGRFEDGGGIRKCWRLVGLVEPNGAGWDVGSGCRMLFYTWGVE